MLLVHGEHAGSPEMHAIEDEIRRSRLVRRLLSLRSTDGRIITYPQRGQTNPYQKWQGPHFTLVCLAEIGYPPGDMSLLAMRNQFYDWLFSEKHMRSPHTLVIKGQEDRVRRCASQEGYAVWYSLMLGIADERTEALVRRIRAWQWPDGGWNCDKRPEAKVSSFHESLIPLRALALHGRLRNDPGSLASAERAADVFLKRRLYKGARSGKCINPDFTLLQYPYFYPYTILFGLKVMTEAGFVGDPRCRDALDLLESKRLPSGGFPLEKRICITSESVVSRGTFADWGPMGRKQMNEFVTADALQILKAAGRL
jgi:hypothetical protein